MSETNEGDKEMVATILNQLSRSQMRCALAYLAGYDHDTFLEIVYYARQFPAERSPDEEKS